MEQWYFDELDALIQQGADATEFWVAFRRADSQSIRDYLQGLMLDPSLRDRARSEAGTAYFERFARDERLRAYSHTFETMRMPGDVAWGVTQRLLRDQPDQLLDEISRVVRNNPSLGDQTAFVTFAENAHRHASDAARTRLAAALEAGLDREGNALTGRHRDRLRAAAEQLKRAK